MMPDRKWCSFSIESAIRMQTRLHHLIDTSKVGRRPTWKRSSMRPPRAIGSLIRSSEVSMAGRCTNTSISCRTDSPVQERSVGASSLSSCKAQWSCGRIRNFNSGARRHGSGSPGWPRSKSENEASQPNALHTTSTWRPTYCAAPWSCADPSRVRFQGASESFKMSITLTAREARPASGLILFTMSLGVLIAQIDTSVVNLAVKPIGTDLKASVTELQWIVDVYNFVYASLLLTAGTLADLYGRRRIFALGIALFTLGTVVCGLAPDVPTLVAGRAVAGLGAALEVPASLAILTIAYPDTKERTRALGIWASCYGIAIVIGPTAGGALVDSSGWRSIFLLIIPFCLVTLVLVMTVVPESSNPQGRRLDLLGQALAITSLGNLSLAAIEGPRWGWASLGSVAAFSLSVVTAVLFLRRQAGATDAVVPLPMLRQRVFAACLAVATAMNFGAYAMRSEERRVGKGCRTRE